MQESINNGATPEQAAREAAMASENLGISVSQGDINKWTNIARKLSKVTISSDTETTQPVKINPYTLRPEPAKATYDTKTANLSPENIKAYQEGISRGIGNFFINVPK